MISSALFSPCRKYRYRLYRKWGPRPLANFVLLNPSVADEFQNDPTVERLQARALNWGYGGLVVTNIFAWRSTDPSVLMTLPDPVGRDNDSHIEIVARGAGIVICGWGNHGQLNSRGDQVLELLRLAGVQPHALRVTKAGCPEHPLYLSYQLKPKSLDPDTGVTL